MCEVGRLKSGGRVQERSLQDQEDLQPLLSSAIAEFQVNLSIKQGRIVHRRGLNNENNRNLNTKIHEIGNQRFHI